MVFRVCKTLLVAACALHWTLVAFNNVVDYGTNLQFVQHVLSMDTVFPADRGSARAIHSDLVHHAGYCLIIATEMTAAVLCWLGAARSWRAASVAAWRAASSTAVIGITLAMILFFTGFITVGGEWFMMWQSSQWNGVDPATRLFLIHGVVLLWLTQSEPEA
jgi:predicted small integral membrane protein